MDVGGGVLHCQRDTPSVDHNVSFRARFAEEVQQRLSEPIPHPDLAPLLDAFAVGVHAYVERGAYGPIEGPVQEELVA